LMSKRCNLVQSEMRERRKALNTQQKGSITHCGPQSLFFPSSISCPVNKVLCSIFLLGFLALTKDKT